MEIVFRKTVSAIRRLSCFMTKMATIKDVAAEAGVAISTVSKVLNDYPGVSASTKEKVNSAIERLSFKPNAVASALSSKKTGRIALLMNMGSRTGAIDQINMQYLSGAIKAAREYELDAITIFFNMIEDMDLDSLISYLKSQSVEGIIVYGMSKDHQVLIDLIKSQVFKAVVMDAPLHNESTSAVWIDHEKAQADVLLKTMEGIEGNRVLYIAGKESSFVTEYKLKGIRLVESMVEAPTAVYYGDYSELKAREITIKHATECDVIACGSDLMAIGAMRALMDMDIFKPVCGFDGIILMAYAGKQMNTVKQDFDGLSHAAVAELKQLIDGKTGDNVYVEYELARMKYEDVLM